MSEWISVEDKKPNKEGDILVLIGEKVFIGKAEIRDTNIIYLCNEESIIYELYKKEKYLYTPQYEFKLIGIGWRLPSHYKEPSHWMYIPQIPKEKNE